MAMEKMALGKNLLNEDFLKTLQVKELNIYNTI
jgi:hypothetical protein